MGRIVHFGLGNFARAHLLDYTADAGGWDVVGVSLRSDEIRDGLKAQGFAYGLAVQGVGLKRIDILREVLVAPEDPSAVLAAMTGADIISASVTEKGYHLGADGLLDLSDPSIQADLSGTGPNTLIGFLANHLSTRHTPLTVMSCDNRVENGSVLKAAVQRFAESAQIAINWALVSFPNAMVDRITPATTDELRTKHSDPMVVPTEAFREWVIEDNFKGPRPNWPDVQFVSDVAPHELRKLRMLNGAHSALAYTGLLRGHKFVHQAIADPDLRKLAAQLMSEAGSTLPKNERVLVPAYSQALVERFENPELAHRLDQIAMDGSQKVPYRFAQTLRAGPAPSVATALDAWLEFCISETQTGHRLNDPLADDIAQAARTSSPKTAILALINCADLVPFISE